MIRISEGTTKYVINEDNIEYIASVGREWVVHFTSGASLVVREKTAKEIIKGYAKKRKDVQPGAETGEV